MVDFSDPKIRDLYVAEVRKRMGPPAYMSLEQAQMLVAVLMTEPKKPEGELDKEVGVGVLEQHDQHCLLTVAGRENGYTFRIVHIGVGGVTLSDHGGMRHVRWRSEVSPSRGWFHTGGEASEDDS